MSVRWWAIHFICFGGGELIILMESLTLIYLFHSQTLHEPSDVLKIMINAPIMLGVKGVSKFTT